MSNTNFEKLNLRPGSKVKVVREFRDWNGWITELAKYTDKVGTVVKDTTKFYGITTNYGGVFKIKFDDCVCFEFPEAALEHLKRTRSKKPVATPPKFKVGDTVKVVSISSWCGWVPSMSRYVGQTFKIGEVTTSKEEPVILNVYREYDNCGSFYFPEDSLELVVEETVNKEEIRKEIGELLNQMNEISKKVSNILDKLKKV